MKSHALPAGVTERLDAGATIYLALRQHFEMTLEFASEYAGIAPERLWEIEGGVEPTEEEREALAIAYGVDEDVLISL
ncbi:MAG: helix-turn-helix transcriptional regulator [Aurantimonas endophytica]|uniref:helix-turn-helix domain-containing protein n=1 Tax=Aurantimonas endophytica TaxID=1522175 RepID=UPI003002528F